MLYALSLYIQILSVFFFYLQANSSSGVEGDAVNVDIEGSSDESNAAEDSGVTEFDEYEWAGQTRVRANGAFNNFVPR